MYELGSIWVVMYLHIVVLKNVVWKSVRRPDSRSRYLRSWICAQVGLDGTTFLLGVRAASPAAGQAAQPGSSARGCTVS